MKLEKVDTPDYNDRFCDRCSNSYCDNCIDFETVDFDIEEIITPEKRDKITVNWKYEKVCPWCYNQLIDLKKELI